MGARLVDEETIKRWIAEAIASSPGGGGVESVTAGDASITVGGTATNPTVKLPYLVYTALLNQSGTDAPVATVLQNTLGGTVVWTRDSAGYYIGTLAGAFTENKTMLIPSDNKLMALFFNTPFDYGFEILRSSVNDIYWKVYKTSDGAFEEWSTLGSTPLSIEIRVYP